MDPGTEPQYAAIRRTTTYECTSETLLIPIASFLTVSGLFTFFSKFFSSFAHATCSLSVSPQYLALDGTYHPLKVAFPNNPTLRLRNMCSDICTLGMTRDSHPLWRFIPKDFTKSIAKFAIQRLQFNHQSGGRFSI